MNKALKKALERQREITAAAQAENRDLTEEETREFERLQGMIDALTEEERGEGGNPNPLPEEAPAAPQGERGQGGTETPNMIPSEDAAAISNMCRHFGIDAGDYLARGLSVQQVQADIIARQMQNQAPVGTRAEVTVDEADKLRRAMTDGILLRSGVGTDNPSDGANSYRAMSIRDIAIECMERQNDGRNYRHMDTERLFHEVTRDFYNPESAFPSILDDVVKKSYVEGLNKANVSFDKWVKFGTLSNFKKTTNHEYIMSLGGKLDKVPENGELKAYMPEDVKMPERQLETYGKQFTMSRKAFIDDDIGMITTMPRRYAEMSMRTQNEAVYNILLGDGNIYDGKPLFSKARKNTLEAGTDVTLDVIQKMIYMIGIQKDDAGNQLALVPDLFIVPFGLGVEVQKLLGTPTFFSAAGTVTNPYYNKNFEIVEDVTLNGIAGEGNALPWFMGVKNQIIQVDYLNGQKEATIRRSERPGTLGYVWDVIFDFGVSLLHPQAICKNPGKAFEQG